MNALCLRCCFHAAVIGMYFQHFSLQTCVVIITGGSDYSFTTQSFLLHSGERRCTSIEILDDTIVEQNTEYVEVQLETRPSYGNAATYYYTTIYIQDNDGE